MLFSPYQGCCVPSHPGSLLLSAPFPCGKHLGDHDLVFSFWPQFSPDCIIWETNELSPSRKCCFAGYGGIADVLIVNGVLEQTVWKGWVSMVLVPCKPFGKVPENHPVETNPALPSVRRSSACSTVLFGAALDDARLSSWGDHSWRMFLPLAPLILLLLPPGSPSLAAGECLPWARG